MTCPHCAEPMHADDEYGDQACPACGLAGPREVLEALAARLSPAGVLEAAERALREREVHMVALRKASGVTLWGVSRCKITSRGTLADAVGRLDKPQVTGGRDG